MREDELLRRSFVIALSKSLGVAALGLDWSAVAQAAHDAHAAAATSPAGHSFSVLSVADAADVEALTSQIVPSDDTPGAREAGVVYFIDRGLGSFFAHFREPFIEGLRQFQTACREHFPQSAAFAALSHDEQLQFLTTVERTAFFDQTRLLTICGLFSMAKYGGNRDGVGWKILGFEDHHVFQPPFGYYDRDYAGFVIDP